MYLCPECFLPEFCRKLKARLVGDAELANPAFIADFKAYAHAHGCQNNVSCDGWADHLASLYRDYPGEIVDGRGRPVWLDTEVLDVSRYWFRDTCKPVAEGVTPRIRREAWERVRVMATILRANDSAGTRLWGIRAANDAEPPKVKPKANENGRCAFSEAYVGRSLIRYSGSNASLFDADIYDDDTPF